jgi:hypothetical protein
VLQLGLSVPLSSLPPGFPLYPFFAWLFPAKIQPRYLHCWEAFLDFALLSLHFGFPLSLPELAVASWFSIACEPWGAETQGAELG